MSDAQTRTRPISEIERHILSDRNLDDLGEMILSLAREIWVLSDRFYLMEEIFKTRGIDLRAEIDAFEPTAEIEASLAEKRQALIGELLRAMRAELPVGVTQSSKFS